MHPGIAILEPVRDVEVDPHDRGDQEDAAADALVPWGVLLRLADVVGLSGIEERAHAQLRAAQD